MYTALLRQELAKRTRDIGVGLIGAGAMGKGLLYQVLMSPGVRCVALADIRIDVAVSCAEELRAPYRLVKNRSEFDKAVSDGVMAICEDGQLVAGADQIDVLVESSNAMIEGAKFALTAIDNGKHVVLMNAEIDQIFGPAFSARARRNGVVCTSCDGDQHGVLMNVISDLEFWGFDLVMAGNVKGFHDVTATPVSIKHEAEKRRLDPVMCTAYTDGTKLNIEMAVLANALGLRTDVVGMHGPRAAHVDDSLGLFDLDKIREGGPVVDYLLGAKPGGGVYAIGYHDQPFQSFMMNYYKMGDGPYYVFYRPYHLCHVEALASIIQPVIHGTGLLTQDRGFSTNVFAYAKQPLRAGTKLDGLGGHHAYGLIENTPGGAHPGLPICLAHNVVLKHDININTPIQMSDVIVPEDRFDFELYREAISVDQPAESVA